MRYLKITCILKHLNEILERHFILISVYCDIYVNILSINMNFRNVTKAIYLLNKYRRSKL